jgi:hypothetical protein
MIEGDYGDFGKTRCADVTGDHRLTFSDPRLRREIAGRHSPADHYFKGSAVLYKLHASTCLGLRQTNDHQD